MFGPITRIPLVYTPESNTNYRWDRLPAPHEYAGMQLGIFPSAVVYADDLIRKTYVWYLMAPALLTVLSVVVAPLLPVSVYLPISFGFSCFSLLFVALSKTGAKNIPTFLWAVLWPPAAILLAHYFGGLFLYRFWASTFLVLPAVLLVHLFASGAISLWRDALLTDVRITPQQRNTMVHKTSRELTPIFRQVPCQNKL